MRKINFYEEINDDPSQMVKTNNDRLIGRLLRSGEITEKVADYLLSGGSTLSSFYHLLKTHKMPCDDLNISDCQKQGFLSVA